MSTEYRGENPFPDELEHALNVCAAHLFDLQRRANMVQCAYCGAESEAGTDMQAHMEQCEKHPMSALRAEVARLRRESLCDPSGIATVTWKECCEQIGEINQAHMLGMEAERARAEKAEAEVERLRAALDTANATNRELLSQRNNHLAALARAREALRGLRQRDLKDGPCWCFLWPDEDPLAAVARDGHDDACRVARAVAAEKP